MADQLNDSLAELLERVHDGAPMRAADKDGLWELYWLGYVTHPRDVPNAAEGGAGGHVVRAEITDAGRAVAAQRRGGG